MKKKPGISTMTMGVGARLPGSKASDEVTSGPGSRLLQTSAKTNRSNLMAMKNAISDRQNHKTHHQKNAVNINDITKI